MKEKFYFRLQIHGGGVLQCIMVGKAGQEGQEVDLSLHGTNSQELR